MAQPTKGASGRPQVFITGGASGIGFELARTYLQDGWGVTLLDMQPAEPALATLRSVVPDAAVRAFAMDVTQADTVRATFDEAALTARPDLVVHCAGICQAAAFEDITDAAYTRMITVNLLGSRNVALAASAHLSQGGQFVLVASMAGLVGCYGYTGYCASKYGVVGLAEVLRIEWAPRGIAVSVVCPPEVETPMVVAERQSRPAQTATLKLMSGTLPVDYAVSRIRAGIDRRRFLIIPGVRARLLWGLNKLLPGALTRRLADAMVRRSH